MSNFNTNEEEKFNDEETKVTIRLKVDPDDASHVLTLFNAPAPPIGEIDEIHLIIRRSDSA